MPIHRLASVVATGVRTGVRRILTPSGPLDEPDPIDRRLVMGPVSVEGLLRQGQSGRFLQACFRAVQRV